MGKGTVSIVIRENDVVYISQVLQMKTASQLVRTISGNESFYDQILTSVTPSRGLLCLLLDLLLSRITLLVSLVARFSFWHSSLAAWSRDGWHTTQAQRHDFSSFLYNELKSFTLYCCFVSIDKYKATKTMATLYTFLSNSYHYNI